MHWATLYIRWTWLGELYWANLHWAKDRRPHTHQYLDSTLVYRIHDPHFPLIGPNSNLSLSYIKAVRSFNKQFSIDSFLGIVITGTSHTPSSQRTHSTQPRTCYWYLSPVQTHLMLVHYQQSQGHCILLLPLHRVLCWFFCNPRFKIAGIWPGIERPTVDLSSHPDTFDQGTLPQTFSLITG